MEWNWETFYAKAMDWLIVHVPKIIAGIIVLLVGLWVINLLSRVLKKTMERRRFNASIRYFLQNLVAISLQILVVFLSLQVAGIQLTFFAAIVAGLSVAAGLALSGTLQNFVSGILILVLRPYRVGDIVIIQGQQGTVTSVLIFYTLVVTFDHKTIIVPNGQLSNNVVINLSKEGKRRIDVSLKFPYKIDFQHTRTILTSVVSSVPGILHHPPPRVGVDNLEIDKYTVNLEVWTDTQGFDDTRLLLQEKVMESLKTNGLIL